MQEASLVHDLSKMADGGHEVPKLVELVSCRQVPTRKEQCEQT